MDAPHPSDSLFDSSAGSPSVAVVILNWNGQAFLERFLASVCASTYPRAEIWLADNASTDSSVAWTRKHFPSVHVLEMDHNRGFTGGYNYALAQIDAEYFVLLNQDVEVDAGWIEPIIERMETDPGVGAASPKLRAFDDRGKFEYAGAGGGMLDVLGYPFCRGRIFDSVEADEGQYDDVAEVFWVSGAAMFIRASLYRDLGGLDEDFFAHMEEIDLCWRVRRVGYRVELVPTSVVYHVGGGSLDRTNPRKTFLNFRNSMRMLVKNSTTGRLLWTWPLRLALDALAAFRELLAGRFGMARATLLGSWGVLFALPYWINRRRATRRIVREHRRAEDRTKAAGWYAGSIVLEHFVWGKKTWREIDGG